MPPGSVASLVHSVLRPPGGSIIDFDALFNKAVLIGNGKAPFRKLRNSSPSSCGGPT